MNHAWWKQAVFYEVYMPSFCDGNGDGIGDFKGLTSKLDYLKELGIDGIWLTPFYKSPKVDNGYDIADYYSIDEDYGSMADFETFVKQAHEREIKVIADLVLNHTSSEHPWFKDARSSKDHPKRDWYIWKDPVEGGPPTNWESFFGGSAWEFDQESGQYYYHAFAKEQVDLNWTNPEVKQAMGDVMAFWLDKGIDGFRLDVINFLTVNKTFKNNPYDSNGTEQLHLYDKDQEGILDTVHEISEFVHGYPDKFLVGEVGSEELSVLQTYSGDGKLDVVFNFNLGSQPTLNVESIFTQLKEMERVYTKDQLPTLFFSSHDMSRHISRFGKGKPGKEKDLAKLMAGLMLTARGVPFIYYGDEIGQRDLILDDLLEMKDVQGLTAYHLALEKGLSEEEALKQANEKGRDKSRSPMQWNSTEYAGFSSVAHWIQLPKDFSQQTVEAQLKDPQSMLSFYKDLIRIRKKNP
ncbi:MAG TPA: alpha-glucosidase, partial [Sporolactobacillaceae bacterium]|nr:alpha-glucosidase [Sporolactobacillaceae bacterium]